MERRWAARAATAWLVAAALAAAGAPLAAAECGSYIYGDDDSIGGYGTYGYSDGGYSWLPLGGYYSGDTFEDLFGLLWLPGDCSPPPPVIPASDADYRGEDGAYGDDSFPASSPTIPAGDAGHYGGDDAYGYGAYGAPPNPPAGGYGEATPAKPPSPPRPKEPPRAPVYATVTSQATFKLSLEELEGLDIDALTESLLASLRGEIGLGTDGALLADGTYEIVQTVTIVISTTYGVEGEAAGFDIDGFRTVYAARYGLDVEDVVATTAASSRRSLLAEFDLQVDGIFPAERKSDAIALASVAGGADEVAALAAAADLNGLSLRSAPQVTVRVQTEILITDAAAAGGLDTDELEAALIEAIEDVADEAGFEVEAVADTEAASAPSPPPPLPSSAGAPEGDGDAPDVTPGGDSKGGLGDGAIAGIVCGALAFAGAAGAGIFVIRRRGAKADGGGFTALSDLEEGRRPPGATQVFSNPTAADEALRRLLSAGTSEPDAPAPRAAAFGAAKTPAATMATAGKPSEQRRAITPPPKSTRPRAGTESHTVSFVASFGAVSFELLEADASVGRQFWMDVVRTVALGANVPEHRVAVVELTPRPLTNGGGTDGQIDVTFCEPHDPRSARCSCLRFLFNLDNDREAIFGLEDFESVYCRPTIASVNKTAVDVSGLLKFQRAVNRMVNLIRLGGTRKPPPMHSPGSQQRQGHIAPTLGADTVRSPSQGGAPGSARAVLTQDSSDEEDAISIVRGASAAGARTGAGAHASARARDSMFDTSSSDDDVTRRPAPAARTLPLRMPQGVSPASAGTSAQFATHGAQADAARGGGAAAEPASKQQSTRTTRGRRTFDIDFDSD